MTVLKTNYALNRKTTLRSKKGKVFLFCFSHFVVLLDGKGFLIFKLLCGNWDKHHRGILAS